MNLSIYISVPVFLPSEKNANEMILFKDKLLSETFLKNTLSATWAPVRENVVLKVIQDSVRAFELAELENVLDAVRPYKQASSRSIGR